MGRLKQRKLLGSQNEDSFNIHRRSSLKVNLSFTSEEASDNSLSNSSLDKPDELLLLSPQNINNKPQENSIHKRTPVKGLRIISTKIIKPASNTDAAFAITHNDTVNSIQEEIEELNKSCVKLKNEIVNRTRVLYDEPNELTQRMSEVLSTNVLILKDTVQRSPTVKVNIGRDEQITMSGDGKKTNPVQIDSMIDKLSINSLNSSNISNDTSSMANTPKKSKVRTSDNHQQSYNNESHNKVQTNLFRLEAKKSDTLIPVQKEEEYNSHMPIEMQSIISGNVISPVVSQNNKKLKRLKMSVKSKDDRIEAIPSSNNSGSPKYFSCSSSSPPIKSPVKCSSFIENNVYPVSKRKKLNALIYEVENSTENKTIVIDKTITRSACMEITTIPQTMPIITNRNRERNLRKSTKNSKENLDTKHAKNNPIYLEDCSLHTVHTSLNVNTSLDRLTFDDDKPDDILEEIKEKKQNKIESPKKNINIEKLHTNNEKLAKSSLQVNTSIDSSESMNPIVTLERVDLSPEYTTKSSVQKSPINDERDSSFSIEDIQEDKSNDLDNISLMERLRNISVSNKKSSRDLNDKNQNSKSHSSMKDEIESNNGEKKNTSSEIKKEIMYSTLTSIFSNIIQKNPVNKLLNISDDDNKPRGYENNPNQCATPKYLDTVILDSDDSIMESNLPTSNGIVDETVNISIDMDDNNKDKRKHNTKRKLFRMKENSQLLSLTPCDIMEAVDKDNLEILKQNSQLKKKKEKKRFQKEKSQDVINDASNNPDVVSEDFIDEFELLPIKEKPKKKPRKINSKKIIIKKKPNMSILKNVIENDSVLECSKDRHSLKEFDLKTRSKNKDRRLKKTVVATGLPKEKKALVRSAVKTLGEVLLEPDVTHRTTHVVTSGEKTINLLKGIIRGCWIVNINWISESLKNKRWVDPLPFEITTISKAVQENRQDKQLFGKSYVPELFVTCGLIHIDNDSSPPSNVLKDLVELGGGHCTDNPKRAKIIIGQGGLKEMWILDSISAGELKPLDNYKKK